MSNDWMRPYLMFNPDAFHWSPEHLMMAIINSGSKLRQKAEMTREFFENLSYLMVSQMDSELVGAYGYMPIVYIAPEFDPDELRHVPQIVHDEFIHGNRIKDCLDRIGFNTDKWIQDHQEKYNYRLFIREKLHGKDRPTSDLRVNIFYYPLVFREHILTWMNFTIFQFVEDRGAGEQLRDAVISAFEPWINENLKIMREENRHIAHGDRWTGKLFRQYPDIMQDQFDLWFPRALATFGKPDSERNALWRKLGLKNRTNEEVLRAFLDREDEPLGLQAANRKIGLKIPPTEEVIAIWRKGDYLRDI